MKRFLYFLVVILFLNLFNYEIINAAITKDNVKDEVPPEYIPLYQSVAKKYGVPWYLLASIHNQETSFSADVNESSAGATGHTQFMPCTWVGWSFPGCAGTNGKSSQMKPEDLINVELIKKHGGYGVDGNQDGKSDPFDIVDAMFAMGKYLSKSYGSGKTESEKIKNAVYTYNHSNSYVNEVYDRYLRYEKYFNSDSEIKSPQGTADIESRDDDSIWLPGVSSGPDGKLNGEIDGQKLGTGDSSNAGASLEYIHQTIFADYEEEIGNIGVNKKRNHDKTYQTYKTNKVVSFLIEIFYNITMAIGFILIGYISLLWMFVLIARTRFEPLYKAVLFMTGGKIDAFDDFGKLIKLTLIFLIFIIISMSGLLPLLFAAIYKFFSMFITFVFRL